MSKKGDRRNLILLKCRTISEWLIIFYSSLWNFSVRLSCIRAGFAVAQAMQQLRVQRRESRKTNELLGRFGQCHNHDRNPTLHVNICAYCARLVDSQSISSSFCMEPYLGNCPKLEYTDSGSRLMIADDKTFPRPECRIKSSAAVEQTPRQCHFLLQYSWPHPTTIKTAFIRS